MKINIKTFLPLVVLAGCFSTSVFAQDMASPPNALTVDESGKTTVLNTEATVARRTLVNLVNNGAPSLQFTNSNTAIRWELNPNSNDHFMINAVADPNGNGPELIINKLNANVISKGVVTAVNFVMTSSRDVKDNIELIDVDQMLQDVVSLPISRWQYTGREGIDHIGPMAEEFVAKFQVGEDDKHISTGDINGVALAAIQGLHKQVQEKDAKIELLSQELLAQRKMLQMIQSQLLTMQVIPTELGKTVSLELTAN